IRFDPEKGSMQYFDENSGLSNEGFRFSSCLKSHTGELFWGSRTGINYFFPHQLINHPEDIKLNIYRAETLDSIIYLGNNHNVRLRYMDNNIIFRFAGINLRGSRNIQYQYKLDGYDKDWQNGVDLRQARYASLPPGNYTFKLRASTDHINWINAPD